MKLWTIQPAEIINTLMTEGVFVCDSHLSVNYENFQEAYQWMVNEMDKRNIPHPKGLALPIWAWHTRNGKQSQPDLRHSGYGKKGEKYACIELEVPDKEVLLSDFDNWHYVLNNWWMDDSQNEEEWDKSHAWYDNLDKETQNKIMIESWQKIFDIKTAKNSWTSKGQFVQAVFWELRKEMVLNIRYFTAR